MQITSLPLGPPTPPPALPNRPSAITTHKSFSRNLSNARPPLVPSLRPRFPASEDRAQDSSPSPPPTPHQQQQQRTTAGNSNQLTREQRRHREEPTGRDGDGDTDGRRHLSSTARVAPWSHSGGARYVTKLKNTPPGARVSVCVCEGSQHHGS